MSRISTVTHGLGSLVQSMIEDVAERLDPDKGGVSADDHKGLLRGHKGPIRRAARAVIKGHPLHDIGQRLAERLQARNTTDPGAVSVDADTDAEATGDDDAAPADLQAKHGGIVNTLWTCAKLSAEVLEARAKGDTVREQQLKDELKFSTCDPKWLEAVTEYLKFFGATGKRNEIPYIRYQSMDDFVMPTLPADARVALIGDWGTGTNEAIALLEAVKAKEPDVLIHLGDIYYSGTAKESQSYFLDIVNQVFERDTQAIPVYNLTGNHDMYSGGEGFYGILPQLNPSPVFTPEQAQGASYFALRSVDGAWQFLGMDTGLHDHDVFTVSSNITYLDPDEEAWHIDKIERFSSAGGRTILLSHHQLFSAFDGIGKIADKPVGEEAANPKLLESFRNFQQAGDIAGWFWGHEHNLDVYQPYMGLAKGRCMGHAAIPDFADKDAYAVVDGLTDPPELVDGPDGKPLRLGTVDKVYAHGFALIELDDREHTAKASYFQEPDYSKPMYVEEL